MIEPDELRSMKEHCDIVSVAEKLGADDLQEFGRSFKGCCLFHDERTPSMHVFPDDASYYCYGCGASGDVFKMIQEKVPCSFIESVRYLSKEINYVPVGLTDDDGQTLEPMKPKVKPKPRIKPDGRVKWKSIIPVPDKAPRPSLGIFDSKFPGQPVRKASNMWEFISSTGQLLGVDVRYDYFDKPKKYKIGDTILVPGTEELQTVTAVGIDDDKLRCEAGVFLIADCQRKTKEVITWTWAQHIDDGVTKWHRHAWESPAPLYGLDRLAARPDDIVVMTEGCKAADAAEKRNGHIGMTWRGGCKTIVKFERTDWSALAGRHVIIWPDADEGGRDAAWYLVHHLRAVGVASVLVVDTKGLPQGWDLADAKP